MLYIYSSFLPYKSWSIWLIILTLACKPKAPSHEAIPMVHDTVLASISAMAPSVERNALHAILHILARVYKDKVSKSEHRSSIQLVKGLVNDYNNITETMLSEFATSLPHYTDYAQKGNITELLKYIDQQLPFLAPITYRLSTPSSIQTKEVEITTQNQTATLDIYPPLHQQVGTCDLSELIRLHQLNPNTHDAASKRKNKAPTPPSKCIVFDKLPSKLCIAFMRSSSISNHPKRWSSVNLTGTSSIIIENDAAQKHHTSSTAFALVAFLVVDAMSTQQPNHMVAFAQLDNGQWYCANDDKITSISYKEALYAARQGSCFFYSKRKRTN